MQKIKKALEYLYDINQGKETEIQRIENLINTMNKRTYYVPTDLHLLNNERYHLLSQRDNGKAFNIPYAAGDNGLRATICFLNKEEFESWEKKQPDYLFHRRGCLLVNFPELLDIAVGTARKGTGINGLVFNPLNKENIFLSKELLELLYSTVKNPYQHILVNAGRLSNKVRKEVKYRILRITDKGLSSMRAAYYIPADLKEKKDTVIIDCPKSMFALYRVYIYNAVALAGVKPDNLDVVYMYENDEMHALCTAQTEFYCRDKEVPLEEDEKEATTVSLGEYNIIDETGFLN